MNVNGFNTETPHPKEIFADIQSVKRSEFYEGLRSGMNLVHCIVVNKLDYDDAIYTDGSGRKNKPEKVELDGEVFKITRTYQTDEDLLEIICEGE